MAARAGAISGADDINFDEAGLVKSMTVYWRPMEQVVAFQQKLAAKAGFTPLRLVPA